MYYRLVEEVKLRAAQLQLQNEDVYMATSFEEFIQMCVRKLRGEDGEEEFIVDYVSIASVKWVLAYIYMKHVYYWQIILFNNTQQFGN